MKIAVISDTHDNLDNIDQAFKLIRDENVDMLCHLGDWIAPYSVDHIVKKSKELDIPLKGVLGNNDSEVFFIISKNPVEWDMELAHETLVLTIDGKKIILYHGTDRNLTEGLIKGSAFDAVFSGHTHVQKKEVIGNTLVLNPGTLSGYSYVKGGKINQGEFATYDSVNNTAQLITFPIKNI